MISVAFAPSRPLNRYTPREMEEVARMLNGWQVKPAGTRSASSVGRW